VRRVSIVVAIASSRGAHASRLWSRLRDRFGALFRAKTFERMRISL
jgi:hypothetical protein